MRAIWKGHIRFSLVTIPVAIYSAIEKSASVSFRQLHKEDNGPVGYNKVCKHCNTTLKSSDIVKGYEYAPDQYVIIEKEDFEKIKLKSTKVIEIEAFVDASEVPTALYDSPYFAGPDGEIAVKTYGLLCDTLKKTNKLGIGRVVLRDRESIMLIAPEENGLLLYKLRYPNELRKVENVPNLTETETSDAELGLAETLVSQLSKKFGDLELRDRYVDSVKEMIQAKIDGKEIVSLADEDQPVVDIMTALRASIEQAKDEKKPMKKAGEGNAKDEAKAS
ncbi:MAG: Ku protein [Bacteroidota bacterium]